MMRREFVPYRHGRNQIQDADLLLFRRPRSLIARLGRGEYSHAARAVWACGVLLVCEIREWYGGRARPLSGHVRRCAGLIDVYRPDYGSLQSMRRHQVAQWTLRATAVEYSYRGVLALALRRLPLVRLLVRHRDTEAANGARPMFCSELIARGDRVIGECDPVPNLPDHRTGPNDLARSPFYKYQFTLLAGE